MSDWTNKMGTWDNMIISSEMKAQTTDTENILHELQNYHAEWKKVHTKLECML